MKESSWEKGLFLSLMVSAYQIMNSSFPGLRKTPTWTHGVLIIVFLIIDPFSMCEANKNGWERDLQMSTEASEENKCLSVYLTLHSIITWLQRARAASTQDAFVFHPELFRGS